LLITIAAAAFSFADADTLSMPLPPISSRRLRFHYCRRRRRYYRRIFICFRRARLPVCFTTMVADTLLFSLIFAALTPPSALSRCRHAR